MKAFFKKLEVRKQERIDKDSLTNELKSRVEDALLGRTEEDGFYITNEEASQSLCTALEAIFVHGIKESLTDRMASALGDPDIKPTPEFWSPMMVFTHKNIIQQINEMKQINTDVGRSRAWLRLALNENSILAYLELIAQQNKALIRYYKKTAYLRDVEAIGIAITIFQALSRFAFNFPVNSSILNYWPNAPLLLAGLWTPPMKYTPISTGLDLAKNLQSSDEGESASELLALDVPTTSISRMLHDEAMEVLLNTPVEGSPLSSQYETEKSDSDGYQSCEGPPSSSPKHPPEEPTSSPDPQPQEPQADETSVIQVAQNSPEVSQSTQKTVKVPDITTESYEKILDNYNPKSKAVYKESSLKEFINSSEPATTPEETKLAEINEMGFEVVDPSALPVNKKDDMRVYLKILLKGHISQEAGLDSQQFACRKCGIVIGICSKKPRVCGFSSFYYCEECFNGIEMNIPARILHNWDFGKYIVSESSFTFLIDVMEHPLLNVKKINPKIYFAVEEMKAVQKLRVKLNILRSYLTTCRDPIKKEIQKLLWPKDYLFEHVHVYSISDLLDLEMGKLHLNLKRAIQLSVDHVKSCELCTQKGFICELCSSQQEPSPPIFPFEDDIHRCQICNNVVHLTCFQEHPKCRKCKRIKEHRAKLERHKSEDNS